MKQSKLSSRIWISIVMFGLFGQIAWVIENMYFNLFLYDTISGDTNAIALMVTASAIIATITTMLMGALSDKVGKRKIFICLGYVLWGLSTLSFGFISTTNIEAIFPTANAVMIGVVAVIVMDCIMTFFGSSANDSAFNAWVTDITDDINRPKVEGLLAILPLFALLLIFGAFDGLTKSDNWPTFFFILGGLVTIGGIVGFFLINDSQVQKPKGQYWHELIYGFKPSTIKQHPVLYTTFVAFALFGIATQIYMPYFIIYIQQFLGIDNYALLLGVVILSASIVSLLLSILVKSTILYKLFYPSLGVFIIGLVMLFFVRDPFWVGVAGFVMMAGNLVFTTIIGAKIRDLTPKDKVGHFQGIRMIFYVLIPMVIGPFIGSMVIKGSGMTYVNEYNQIKDIPTSMIFLAAAIMALLIIIPLYYSLNKIKEVQTFTPIKADETL